MSSLINECLLCLRPRRRRRLQWRGPGNACRRCSPPPSDKYHITSWFLEALRAPPPHSLQFRFSTRSTPMDQITKDTKPYRSSFLKKLTCKGIWRQVFIWLRPPPSVTHSINTYPCTYSHREGGGSTSEKVRRGLVHKSGRKYQHD